MSHNSPATIISTIISCNHQTWCKAFATHDMNNDCGGYLICSSVAKNPKRSFNVEERPGSRTLSSEFTWSSSRRRNYPRIPRWMMMPENDRHPPLNIAWWWFCVHGSNCNHAKWWNITVHVSRWLTMMIDWWWLSNDSWWHRWCSMMVNCIFWMVDCCS